MNKSLTVGFFLVALYFLTIPIRHLSDGNAMALPFFGGLAVIFFMAGIWCWRWKGETGD